LGESVSDTLRSQAFAPRRRAAPSARNRLEFDSWDDVRTSLAGAYGPTMRTAATSLEVYMARRSQRVGASLIKRRGGLMPWMLLAAGAALAFHALRRATRGTPREPLDRDGRRISRVRLYGTP
jgi:hypothetical protein